MYTWRLGMCTYAHASSRWDERRNEEKTLYTYAFFSTTKSD